MIMSLFGSVKKQENALRASLSGDKFAVEFDHTMAAFEIEPVARPGKSSAYCEAEAGARFMLEQALKIAVENGVVKNAKDLEAVTAFGVILVTILGRNAGLSAKECRELNGTVAGYVLAHAAQSMLGAKAAESIGKIVTKGVLSHTKLSGKKRFKTAVKKIEDSVTQFVSQRDITYLDVLSRNIDAVR